MELKRAGRVLICASHVTNTLRQLSTKAVWLDHGSVKRLGPAAEVIDAYEASLNGKP
jgi:ABC-type polysaccharide/polyol phosphate transport system ATPase subunit